MLGLSPILTKIIGAGVILAALWFVWNEVTDSYYERGKSDALAAVAKRDAVATKAANDRIRVLELDARDKEAKHGQEVNAITANLRKGNADELTKKDALIAGLRAGTVKLRIATVCPTAGDRSATGAPGDTSAPTDGAGNTGYVGSDDAEVLVTEFALSDDRARKVNALQSLVLEQIRVCNQ